MATAMKTFNIVRMEIKDASGEGSDDNTIILEYWGQYNKVMMYNHDDGRFRGGLPGAIIIVEDALAYLTCHKPPLKVMVVC